LQDSLPGFIELHIVQSQNFSLIEFSDVKSAERACCILEEQAEAWMCGILSLKDRRPLKFALLDGESGCQMQSLLKPIQLATPGKVMKDICGVPGLHFLASFLSADEELSLLDLVCNRNGSDMVLVKNRFVAHYGHNYDYSAFSTSTVSVSPIPDQAKKMILHRAKMQLIEFGVRVPAGLNQMTVQLYPPGSGIGAHIDSPSAFGDTILILSLKSTVTMEFYHSATGNRQSVELWPRSLICMQADARYHWKHQIKERMTDLVSVDGHVVLQERSDRVSLTFRMALL
jgi:alkylated DNA repair dioxygenase AlkB